MIAHANLPAYSSLERVVQQATVVRQYLQQEVGKVNIAKYFLANDSVSYLVSFTCSLCSLCNVLW